jgi:hypothetical protein
MASVATLPVAARKVRRVELSDMTVETTAAG